MDLLVLNNPIKAVSSINRICVRAKYSECTEGQGVGALLFLAG